MRKLWTCPIVGSGLVMRRPLTTSFAVLAAAVLARSAGAGAASNDHGKFETLPDGEAMGLDIEGVAKIKRTSDSTRVQVHVRGLEPNTTYAAHLHNASCSAPNPGGGHYQDDPAGPAEPPNELWLSSDRSDPKAGITARRSGVAHGRGSADWVARPEASSVVIHAIPPGGTTAGGPKIACADLD